MKNFWNHMPRPFFALAPLANVTDAAFRRMVARYSKPYGPHVIYTEFVSADGLIKGNKDILLKDLMFDQLERPIVAQFFTSDPAIMEEVARMAEDLGFDGIDINMGCPDKSVEKQGSGAALMKKPEQAVTLIEAAKKGAKNIPVSVKTRLGYNKDTLEEWLPSILSALPAAVAIHARTRKELSLVPAHWERVGRAVEIRNELKSNTLIIGNGDVKNLEEARNKASTYKADGIMIGRAIFGTPWFFNENSKIQPIEKLEALKEHIFLFKELLGTVKNFSIMKRHFKSYIEGFDGAKELRSKLMEVKSAEEAIFVIDNYIHGTS